jgi:hypothetical protein
VTDYCEMCTALMKAGGELVHEVLKAVCRRDALSVESSLEPGEEAGNFELALRLKIGYVFGLDEDA